MSEKPTPTPRTVAAEAANADLEQLAAQVRRIRGENEELFGRLLAGERRLRSLARTAWQAQERERRRLAGELHDGLGQTLTALKIHLDRLAARDPDSSLAGELAAAAGLAGQALGEARRLSHSLRPQVLDDLGLAPALRWLARTLRELTGFEVRLEIGALPGERLHSEVETLLFRITQEALNNALKHSGASGAEVRLDWREEHRRLLLEVADGGRGFDARATLAEYGDGGGLRGLNDRVEVFGGRLRVESQPGRGTTLSVSLPLENGGGEVH